MGLSDLAPPSFFITMILKIINTPQKCDFSCNLSRKIWSDILSNIIGYVATAIT